MNAFSNVVMFFFLSFFYCNCCEQNYFRSYKDDWKISFYFKLSIIHYLVKKKMKKKFSKCYSLDANFFLHFFLFLERGMARNEYQRILFCGMFSLLLISPIVFLVLFKRGKLKSAVLVVSILINWVCLIYKIIKKDVIF